MNCSKIKSNLLIPFLLLPMIIFNAGIANAAPIDFGAYLNSNDLDWLDVTETSGRSYNDVLNSLSDSNDELFGWRYATSSEFVGLMADFGFFPGAAGDCIQGHTLYCEDAEDAAAVASILGATLSFTISEATLGILADFTSGSVVRQSVAVVGAIDFGQSGIAASVILPDFPAFAMLAGGTNFIVGSYLVCATSVCTDYNNSGSGSNSGNGGGASGGDSGGSGGAVSVSEPSPLILLCLGSIGLAFSRRKQS